MSERPLIEVKNVTLTYRSGKGVFDLDFNVKAGEIMGYLGPNGAGKTTTIRALLGFMKPDRGECLIGGLDCTKNAAAVQQRLGYIPGEITFPDDMHGDEFLKFISDMRRTAKNGHKGLNNNHKNRQKELTELFELDLKGRIRKFSKGMKQKLAIVTAFMHDPEILILDEPTSGLDPLMQNRFEALLSEEKSKGKTILMSSHLFEEVEKTCDNVLIIKDGRIVKQSDIHGLAASQRKTYIVRTSDAARLAALMEGENFETGPLASADSLEIFVNSADTGRFIRILAGADILDLDVKAQTLEDVFMQFYTGNTGDGGAAKQNEHGIT
ncbi:MAG: ABC transporter ATP-binding protein [Eubacteriales bacterium]|nr:ABC transporter ATP-binding protein [Eubacteriales bacterium]